MTRTCPLIGCLLLAAAVVTGCGPGHHPQEKEYQLKAQVTPLDRAKTLLNNYAKGQPVGSEAASFPEIVEELKKTDPEKARVLEQGFERIQKAPGSASAEARATLQKL